MLKRMAVILVLAAMLPFKAMAAEPFDFMKHETPDSIRRYIEKNLPLGSKREDWRKAFVTEGRAALKEHPRMKGVEKYLFDINLCERAIYRWNISADFDDAGKLLQAYINGRFVFMAGKEPRTINMFAAGGTMTTVDRERIFPEIKTPEGRVKYLLHDIDGNFDTPDDQIAEGDVTARADPANIGITVPYKVELWRSAVDEDEGPKSVAYTPCTGNIMRDPALDELLLPEVQKMQRELDRIKSQQLQQQQKP